MFNTLRYAKMLEEVGFSREQAETSIKILVEIMEDKLASKHDLKELETNLQHSMSQLEIATKQDLKELETNLQHSLSSTKQDMKELETNLQYALASTKQDMKEIEVRLLHSMSQLESKLTIKMGTMLAASIAILTAIQKLV